MDAPIELANEVGRLREQERESRLIVERANALLAGEKRLLEMVATGCALPIVLEALCTLVEETATNSPKPDWSFAFCLLPCQRKRSLRALIPL